MQLSMRPADYGDRALELSKVLNAMYETGIVCATYRRDDSEEEEAGRCKAAQKNVKETMKRITKESLGSGDQEGTLVAFSFRPWGGNWKCIQSQETRQVTGLFPPLWGRRR